VVAVEHDSLWVETLRQSTCGACSAQKACGHGLLNRFTAGRKGLIRVLPGACSPRDCRVDDEVRISIPEEVILRGSLIAYVLPLLCMLAGAGLSVRFLPGGEDVLAAFGAVAGLAVGFALVRLHGERHRNDESFQPVLVEVLQPASEPVRIA